MIHNTKVIQSNCIVSVVQSVIFSCSLLLGTHNKILNLVIWLFFFATTATLLLSSSWLLSIKENYDLLQLKVDFISDDNSVLYKVIAESLKYGDIPKIVWIG